MLLFHSSVQDCNYLDETIAAMLPDYFLYLLDLSQDHPKPVEVLSVIYPHQTVVQVAVVPLTWHRKLLRVHCHVSLWQDQLMLAIRQLNPQVLTLHFDYEHKLLIHVELVSLHLFDFDMI